uniref:Protein kinase domain-containing protein n=1 Tax=viral metagenome TaxID=1070528 RepID=A0A6C0ERV9_9ZZZZ
MVKNINKIKNTNKNINGGNVLASGGFGCAFSPALKCEGTRKRETNKISKLMIEKYTISEYQEITKIKDRLKHIPNFDDYFLLNNINICRPAKITKADLKHFNKKCSALPKNNITKKNINKSLDKLMLLNMPDGGLPVDDYIFNNGSLKKMLYINTSLINLLNNGILKMNESNIYHCDIKDSNILLKTEDSILKARLIDWGLSTEYIPFKDDPFPRTWRNRPFQYNVPFSVIIFSDSFVDKYTKYIKTGGETDEINLRPFVIDYIHFWIKERGEGHYKLLNEIMYMLFSKEFDNITSKEFKDHIIENDFTLFYITNYIVEILKHFTKFRPDGSLNLRIYLDTVFINIVDIWGFIMTYLPMLEFFYDNYDKLTPSQQSIFELLKSLIIIYLYSPRITPIPINELNDKLNTLNTLLKNETKIEMINIKSTNISSNIAKGVKKNNSLKTKKRSRGITGNTFIPKKMRLIFKKHKKNNTRRIKKLFMLSKK